MNDVTFQLITLLMEERLELCDSEVRLSDLTLNMGKI
jgi:hypothetical protein